MPRKLWQGPKPYYRAEKLWESSMGQAGNEVHHLLSQSSSLQMVVIHDWIFLVRFIYRSHSPNPSRSTCSVAADVYVGPKPATRGGWMGADQNFFRNLNRRPISRKSPKPSSVLAKVSDSYWKAKPTQKASNERVKSQINSEAIRENSWSEQPGPVWPVRWTGLTGRVCSKMSRPVWPVCPTGLTGSTQKTPEKLDSNGESWANDHEIDETWGIASPLPREHIPKRSRPKYQRI